MRNRLALLALFLLFLQGCAVAPLSNHITARSNGKGSSLGSVGTTVGVRGSGWLPSFKYSIGVADDLDIGFQYEVIQYGAWAKYAFVNNPYEGFSLAGVTGVGVGLSGVGGFYGYLGPIASWKLGWFEPFVMTRFNYIDSTVSDIDIASSGEFKIIPGTYRYFQHTLGFMTWPLDWFGIGLEASAFTTVSSPFVLQDKDKFLLSGNFSFRF